MAAPQNGYRSSGTRRMVGPYQLAKTIGAGSMGKVKVALDTRTNKRVSGAAMYCAVYLSDTTHDPY
ncbi:hypothetical protein BX661DRAFT_186704, partial [Kickxella alabastrina]|uniref:uncharacterized protein n=1 Tax=Kickxella alabastrina TaxID=61397 RepID=UPI00221FEFCE